MPDTIRQLDHVGILRDNTVLGVRRGETGTVVDVLGDGKAFEVEFVDEDGGTRAMGAFAAEDLLPSAHRAVVARA